MINPLAVAVEGFGFSPLSISTMGWLTELEILPGAGVWYVPSDLINRIVYEKELFRHTYKDWPVTEKVVANFAGSEVITKSIRVKLLQDTKPLISTIVRAKKDE
jgi:hypothetical protein